MTKAIFLLNQKKPFIPTIHSIHEVIAAHSLQVNANSTYILPLFQSTDPAEVASFLRQPGLNIFLLLSSDLTLCGFYSFFLALIFWKAIHNELNPSSPWQLLKYFDSNLIFCNLSLGLLTTSNMGVSYPLIIIL